MYCVEVKQLVSCLTPSVCTHNAIPRCAVATETIHVDSTMKARPDRTCIRHRSS